MSVQRFRNGTAYKDGAEHHQFWRTSVTPEPISIHNQRCRHGNRTEKSSEELGVTVCGALPGPEDPAAILGGAWVTSRPPMELIQPFGPC